MVAENNYFMISLHEKMMPAPAGIEPSTPWSPVGRSLAPKPARTLPRHWIGKIKKKGKTRQFYSLYKRKFKLLKKNQYPVSWYIKNGYFIIQESFNKLIYDINTAIKCVT